MHFRLILVIYGHSVSLAYSTSTTANSSYVKMYMGIKMFHCISKGGLLVFYTWNIIPELGRIRGNQSQSWPVRKKKVDVSHGLL